MRITALVGSARRGANTETLTDALLAGAAEAGAIAEKYCLADKNIAPCRQCDRCMTAGECPIRDDCQELFALLAKTDVLVLSSPVYCFAFSAQILAALDRMYNPATKAFPIKGAALLSVCADEGQFTFDPLRATFKMLAHFNHWRDLGEVTVDGVLHRGDINGNPGLERARALGARIAKTVLP